MLCVQGWLFCGGDWLDFFLEEKYSSLKHYFFLNHANTVKRDFLHQLCDSCILSHFYKSIKKVKNKRGLFWVKALQGDSGTHYKSNTCIFQETITVQKVKSHLLIIKKKWTKFTITTFQGAQSYNKD